MVEAHPTSFPRCWTCWRMRSSMLFSITAMLGVGHSRSVRELHILYIPLLEELLHSKSSSSVLGGAGCVIALPHPCRKLHEILINVSKLNNFRFLGVRMDCHHRLSEDQAGPGYKMCRPILNSLNSE